MANPDPKQLALQLKPQLEAKGYTVDPQGNVRYLATGNGIHPPWSWMQAFPDADISMKLPGSDPKSAWNSMYESGGPFSHGSRWDQDNGTYKGGTDWGNLIGTMLAGGLIAAPALAGALGAGGGAAGASGGLTSVPATEGIASATSLGLPTTAGLGTAGAGGLAGGAASYLAPSEFSMGGASPITGIVPNTVNGAVSSAAEAAGAGGAADGAVGGLTGSSGGGNASIPNAFGSSATDIEAAPLSSNAISGGVGVNGGNTIGSLVPATSGISTTGASGSVMSNLMSKLKNPNNLADLARIADQSATDAQGNRVIQGNMAGQYDRNMLTAQTDRNTTEADALKKLAQTKYILGGGFNTQPASIQMNGQSRTLPTFGMQPQASSDAQKQGAQTLQDQLTKRLVPGGTYTPMPFSDYGTPGAGEKVGSLIGTGLGAAGTIMNMFK